jgi:hypothetical protein
MLFSQRKGHKPVSKIIQRNDVNEELRNTLWNILDLFVWQAKGFLYAQFGESGIEKYSTILWLNYFKKPIDSRANSSYDNLSMIRKYFFSCQWYEVYDFIEFTLRYLENDEVTKTVNVILERELSAYRFVDNILDLLQK